MHLTHLWAAFIAFDHNFLGGSWSLNQQVSKKQAKPRPVNRINHEEVSAVWGHSEHVHEGHLKMSAHGFGSV